MRTEATGRKFTASFVMHTILNSDVQTLLLICVHSDQDLLCTQVEDLRFTRFATLRKSKHDIWMTAHAETNLNHSTEMFANLCAFGGSLSVGFTNSNLYFKPAFSWDFILPASRYFWFVNCFESVLNWTLYFIWFMQFGTPPHAHVVRVEVLWREQSLLGYVHAPAKRWKCEGESLSRFT